MSWTRPDLRLESRPVSLANIRAQGQQSVLLTSVKSCTEKTMRSLVATAVLGTVLATTVPVGAQGVAGGPGCHLLMNQAACVACVKRNLPETYDPRPQGSSGWCARLIAERRANGLGPEPLRWDKKR